MTTRFRQRAFLLLALTVPLFSQSCVCLLRSHGTAGSEGSGYSCEPGCFWLLGGAPIDGCGSMGGPGCGEILDPELDGCFQHPAGRDAGWIRLGQQGCNLVQGFGYGTTELALGSDPWLFDGEVIQGGLTDEAGNELAGVATLTILEGQVLTATRIVSPAGSETLALQGTGRLGEVVRVEMVRAPCEEP